jgi:predicted TIM-barrel fold metal-dependent hydrolase
MIMAVVEDLLLPDPEPREVKYTIVSVDDHLVEPAHAFEGRLPKHLQGDAPRVVENEQGKLEWLFDGELHSLTGLGTTVGLKDAYGGFEATRFEHMRKGCYDSDARVADMDINGVWASLSFPSTLTGFANRVLSSASSPEVGLAATKAWNDWMFEEWYSPNPDRIIPMGLTFLADAEAAAAEIYRNAARGFRAVSLPERPHHIGFPDLFSGYWDPVVQACSDTDTVINLHIGSSGGYDAPDISRGMVKHGLNVVSHGLRATLFGQLSLAACAEWLWSGYPARFPKLEIAMSEGGIGWVAMLLDRLDNIMDRSGYGADVFTELRPAELVKRNFWFCTIDDPSTIDTRYRIGVDNIMVEVDYPHGDSTWPDSQAVIEKCWGHLPNDELRAVCSQNASKLYRFALPPVVLPL